MWPYLQRLALVDPAAFIACQGAVIGAYSPDGALRLIKQERIPLHLALASVALATAAGLPVNWYSGESWYVSDYDEGIERESQVVGLRPIVRRLSRESVGPDKLLVISPADRPDVEVLLGALPDGLVFQQSNHGYFEITSKGTDKGFAVASYAREAGIRTEEVVAIGDGPNDLGMFSIAGVSIAPSNASEAALTAADYITDSNDDNGVATALRAMLP
jgi:Cof subfamily protein (haloacid dehalogenase superfamily)